MILLSLLLAAEFYLESPPMTTRSEALGVQQLAIDEGLEARVVRRYAHGAGWEYVVVVEGLESREAAEEHAESIAGKGGRGITVYRREGTDGVRVGDVESGAGALTDAGLDPTAPAIVAPDIGELPSADEVLQHAIRAVGGRTGGIDRVASNDHLRFSYERTVYGDVVRTGRHQLQRAPGAVRLDVEGIDNVVSSTSIVGPDGAWVTVDGVTTSREPERVEEVLEAFGPEELLAYPLEFARLVDTEPSYKLLRTLGAETVDGRACWRLEYTGPEVGGTMVLLIDAESWYIASVGFTTDAGHVRYGFADWRELDTGLVAPFDVRLERDGEVLETMTIIELSLPPELPGSVFEAQGPESQIQP